MTLEEAIAIAGRVKPKRPLLDKLHASPEEGQTTHKAAALRKRLDGMVEPVADLQKRVDQIAAEVEYLENFKPGIPRRRALQ
jgi:hypothetical protein